MRTKVSRGWVLFIFFLFYLLLPGRTAIAMNTDGQYDPELQELLLYGLEKNLGLQVVRIDSLQAENEISVQMARFDPELFAEASHSASRTPQADSQLSAAYRRKVTHAEVGIRKEFDTGFTSAISLSSKRVAADDEFLDPRYAGYLLLTAEQPLLRNFGQTVNTTDLLISQNQNLQTHYLFLRKAQDLALQIEETYYELIGSRETERLRQQARELVLELLSANRSRLETGVIPVSEVQETETALAGSELQLAQARQGMELIAYQLNNLLNNRLNNPLQLLEQLQSSALKFPSGKPELDQAYAFALENRFDLKALVIDQQNSSLSREFQDNQLKPQLDLIASFGLNGLSGGERSGYAPARYDGSFLRSHQSLLDGDGYQWSAGLNFSYPLGNREAQAKLRQAEQETRRSDYRKRELQQAIETELSQKLVAVHRNQEQVTLAERLQQLAEKTLDQERKRLDEGLSDTFRVLTFLASMIDARINRLSALVEYNKSLARFNHAMGSNLDRHGIATRVEQKEVRFENR